MYSSCIRYGLQDPSVLCCPVGDAICRFIRKQLNTWKRLRPPNRRRGSLRGCLGGVCKTLVRERCWHDTRRFDRQTVGTSKATPAAPKAREGPSECRSSAYHKRHALDRSHRITLARPPPEVWSLEDGCQPLLPLAEGWGVGSSTKSSAEPKRPTRRVRLGGALSGCDHS
jgi:hypothetical protein